MFIIFSDKDESMTSVDEFVNSSAWLIKVPTVPFLFVNVYDNAPGYKTKYDYKNLTIPYLYKFINF